LFDKAFVIEELLEKTPQIIISVLDEAGGRLEYGEFSKKVNGRVRRLVQALSGEPFSSEPHSLWRPAYWELFDSRAVLFEAHYDPGENKKDFIRLNGVKKFNMPEGKMTGYRRYLAAHLEKLIRE